MRIIDLSQPLGASTPVYPGDPPFRARSIADGGFYLREVCMSEHFGTHVDAPAHIDPRRDTIDRIPAEKLVGPAVIADARKIPPEGEVGWSIIREALSTRPRSEWENLIVLVATGALEERGDPWMHPVIGAGAAERLARAGVRGLGVDAPSPDREPFPVHRILLGAGIPIIEGLRGLVGLLEEGVKYIPLLVVAPLPLEGGSGAPARVIAIL